MKAFAQRAALKLDQLDLVIQVLLSQKPAEFLRSEHKNEIAEVRRMITSLTHAFRRMQTESKLSSYQTSMMNHFIRLEGLLQSTYIISSDSTINLPLWESLGNGSVLYIMLKNSSVGLKFKSDSQGRELLAHIEKMQIDIRELITDLVWYRRLRRWLFNNAMGSIDQVRVDMESRYNTQRVHISTVDGKVLDCMFVLGRGTENSSSTVGAGPVPPAGDISNRSVDGELDVSMEQRSVIDVGPTILFCNPNAGIYEFMYFENEWVDFYVNRGINIFLWNYRGYGKSQSFPTPTRLLRDAETVVDYLRSTMNVRKLGVHGESLGGMVAAHVAAKKNLDFLCADRTFSALRDVVRHGLNRVIEGIYLSITFWSQRVCGDYLDTKCYKVITFDPKDEVIPARSSLAFGITEELLMRKFLSDNTKQTSSSPQVVVTNGASNPTSPNELNIPAKTNRFLLAKHPCISRFITTLPFARVKLLRFVLNREAESYVSNYHLNILSSNDYGILFFALKRVFSIIIDSSTRAQKPKRPTNPPSRDEQHNQTSVSFYHKYDHSIIVNTNENVLDELEEEPSKGPVREIKLMQVRDEGYRIALEAEETNEELQSFLINVFSLMELLDSAGCTLDIVFSSQVQAQADLFRNFLVNLEVWGSSLPIKVCLKTEASNDDFNHRLALFKLADFIRKIETFVSMERKNTQKELQRRVLDDLEIIAKKFRLVRERLSSNLALKSPRFRMARRFGSPAEAVANPENQSISEKRVLIDNTTIETTPEQTAMTLEEIKSKVGFLLPLSCGHNGNLNRLESQVFEKHLRAATFIK
eukprot:TRINITY_DN10843_c0_g1_i2.p1 TRINITY_DN10843_c0_g1~~TRINITY_DN10843_c0_g1_i2.p1  ORF type:complete len:812 (+),score=218.85 TRINITY_DN10843_c0_g1_i2:289-2724(+)